MSGDSAIQWTDATWNPTTGCDKVSPGCDNCYALTLAKRLKAMGQAKYQTDGDPRTSGPGFGVAMHPDALDTPLRWRTPRKVFVNSMSDLFHPRVTDEFIARVWQVMGAAPQHTYQILTKRAPRMCSWVSRWYAGEIPEPYDVRPVADYPGYYVTTTGQVLGKRSDTRAGLAEDVGTFGHRRVTMHRDGCRPSGDRLLVHRLVLAAFVRPARTREQACHRNGDPSDNRLSNLYWGSPEDNWSDRLKHGDGRSYAKLDEGQVAEIRRRSSEGQSAYAIAKDYPVSDTQVRNICRGDQWYPRPAPSVVSKPRRSVLDSVHLGVSVEDQQRADERIPRLRRTAAAVRFLSCEPLLGDVDLSRGPAFCLLGRGAVDWVIVGGESGKDARPMDLDWARSLVAQCRAAGVAVFVKQLGSAWGKSHHDIGTWPEDLRVREFPVGVSGA